jgi:transitional endoplasmic reticulum ATPase
MSPPRHELTLVPLADPGGFELRCLAAERREPELRLRQLLAELPALAAAPVADELLDIRVARLNITVAAPDPRRPLFWPAGMTVVGAAHPAPGPSGDGATAAVTAERDKPTGQGGSAEHGGAAEPQAAAKPTGEHPMTIKASTAVLIAHHEEINRAAGYLVRGLSVLVRCEKLLVEHLATEIPQRSNRTAQIPQARAGANARDLLGMPGGRRQELLAALQEAVRSANPKLHVVVVPHLDLLAGGSDAGLSAEARELTDVLYERSECVLLAFVDPSLVIPEVLANRFAVRLAIDILPREVTTETGARVPIGKALITQEEASLFSPFDPVGLYKHIAGLNAVRLRHAVEYAHHQHRHAAATFERLLAELRTFKAVTSSAFEVPNVSFDEIGGYEDVERELKRALRLIAGADALPPRLRQELVPRGFIFHGPPGTGKTLFAKAVATAFDATILVVSGPEVTDMYVGESERKVREIFAEARRNAPAVVVFDEFDSIATRRSGREDGGSRANNAMVAQLLTEMDGFRPEVPVLIIGTTNRLDIIDDALLRPSRFKPIRIDLPDEAARREIAKVHAGHFGVPVSDPLLDRIAVATSRMNGDEIRSVFRDAKADELVGEPRRVADARRLGELVGTLRRSNQERDVGRQAGAERRQGGGRSRAPMIPLPTRAGAPTSSGSGSVGGAREFDGAGGSGGEGPTP